MYLLTYERYITYQTMEDGIFIRAPESCPGVGLGGTVGVGGGQKNFFSEIQPDLVC